MSILVMSLLLGFIIGTSLALLGGGGSILTVPALVYLVGQNPHAAVTTSLAIVGVNSTIGAYFHRSQGTLNGKVALIFGGIGMVVSFLSGGISDHFSPSLLMVGFALLMLAVGLLLIFRPHPETGVELAPLWKIMASGAVVGLLTGILGVGGGFLIVPALVMLVGLTFQQSVGTSLVIIAMNSLAGFLGHLSGAAPDMHLIIIFVGAGLVGSFSGARLTKHLQASQLRKSFAVFVIVLAMFLLVDNLPKLL